MARCKKKEIKPNEPLEILSFAYNEWRPWSIHAASPVILPQDHNTQETLFDPIIKGTTNVMNSGANDWSYIFLLIDPMPFQCHQSLSPQLVALERPLTTANASI
ncbi:hypothetical protein HID58_027164 [Brassica napus]|uniref:Uncharacterized protein n=1 Tax=Brassica napus TaxID=3708 RepID=A0ABQ8CR49_BRANA|nr:hypothetical protein HID58_027164 [Brassica napus]